MSHYSVTDRPIISSITKRLVFLVKREILDLAVEFKVKFYLPTKINYYFGSKDLSELIKELISSI